MDTNEVLNYLRQTPGNTNPNYVKSLLSNTAELFDANFVGTPDPEHPSDLSEITYTCDKSYNELVQAHNAGKLVRMKCSIEGLGVDTWLLQTTISDGTFSSIGMGIANSMVVYLQAMVHSSNTVNAFIIPLKDIE